MALVIQRGREIIRINPQRNSIEYSTTGGRTWNTRYFGSNPGEFFDLLDFGAEILACTSKGVYVSDNDGRTWRSRYFGSACGDFYELALDGKEILATTSRGLYYSTNGGRTWSRRH